MEAGTGSDSDAGAAPEAGTEQAASAATEDREEVRTDEEEEEEEDAELLVRAQSLISKINASEDNPNPSHFHALAHMLETQEAKYMQESANSSFGDGRGSHTIGRLAGILHDNEVFVTSISTKFLSENRFPVSVRAAAARLLLSGSSTWMVLEEAVIENCKNWLMENAVEDVKAEITRDRPSDSEMLKTYSTGILAISLTGGGEIVEDVLSSGLSANLMRYLRLRILGDSSAGHKDHTFPAESKNASTTQSARGKEEIRGRIRHAIDGIHLDGPKLDEGDHGTDNSKSIDIQQMFREAAWEESMPLNSGLADQSNDAVDIYSMPDEAAEQNSEMWQNKEIHSVKARYTERHDDNTDENGRDSRRRVNRGLLRSRGKGRIGEGATDNERLLSSSISEPQMVVLGQSIESLKIVSKNIAINSDQGHPALFDDIDNRASCIVGLRDISDIVKRAIQAAEAEAGTANAPAEAIKAAGDAAADLVKTSALEAWSKTNDSEAAVLAASEAASTVINAALSSEILRTSNINEDSTKAVEQEEEPEHVFLLDADALAQLREKYCIQCLEILGEYVEALGPVLHEKGVDVCLQLLQRGSKQEEASSDLVILPEVLKLICAFAAHKKFAALFVDRGGIQRLLSVQRTAQTFFGLSSCLYTIGCHQGIMERVCALPSGVVNQVVELALQLLECCQDQARKNAAMFLAVAFIFRAIIDSFDTQEGLEKMLNLLHSAASMRSGSNSGTLGLPNERPLPEVLTTSEKQIAYHTCIALRQYFRAHLLLLVDSLRPNKANRSVARNSSSARAAYRPLDISNENMEAIFTQIQRDRKLGPAFVRARWPAVDKFLASNGHITMLELCQAPPGERYLHDLAQYALGVLHIITLVPYSRKPIVNASLSNDRVGMALILDAANGAAYVDPEMIRPALDLLVNLVCPPPSISIKSSVSTQGQQSASTTTPTASATENRDRQSDRNMLERNLSFPIRSELRERDGGEPGHVERATGMASVGSSSHSVAATISSGVVGDRRISLGPGAGCAGFAAQLEQGYHQAREAVRANNGIKVLLHLLHPRMVTPPGSLDCIRALTCRVLLGLARDDTIAHILTKLQVGKKLSELIRDQSSGAEQGRWQAELAQVAIELIAIVTNSGRASTLVATDAAAPTLRRIERAAIAAATPITYDSRELLLLIHEHLQASGLTATAALLQKEATLITSLSVPASQPILCQSLIQEASKVPLQWPSGRASCGFLTSLPKATLPEHDGRVKSDSLSVFSKKKQLPSTVASQGKNQHSPFVLKTYNPLKSPAAYIDEPDVLSPTFSKNNKDLDISQKNADNFQQKTPILLPLKRKFVDCRDSLAPTKRLATMEACQTPVFQTPKISYKSTLSMDTLGLSAASILTPRDHAGTSLMDNSEDALHCITPGSLTTSGLTADTQPGTSERMTLDSLVVQYLKHQHRQCPAPITTLPPLSLLHPHVCPEPSHKLDAPANVTARVSARKFREHYGGIHARRRDRQFVYSRFRPWRTCRDDAALLRCMTFLGDSSRFATGGHSGELKIFDSYSGNVLENNSSHQSPVMFIDSAFSSETQLILTSGSHDVMLWDASSISGGATHTFESCKAARFSQSGTHFAALSSDTSRREIHLYDVQKYDVDQKFRDNLSTAGHSRGLVQSLVHFSPLDTMLLWNGILWDQRCSNPVHHFDQFTDYGGGGFHPAGNEVIINSEVWDLRKFKLLRSVPSLDQTIISFNGSGNVIYAILRRNMEDITSAGSMRRYRHPLFAAFRTIDATNYSDIATIPVDRRVLDLATEPTDSCVGIVAVDDPEEFSSARLYEIGRKRPTDDDSDPDDGAETDEEDEEDEEDSEGGVDALLDPASDGDGDSEADDLSEDDEVDSIDDEAEFNIDVDFDGQGVLEIASDAEDDDSEALESMSDEDEDYVFY